MQTSVKRVKDKKELEQAVEDATIEGWSVHTRSDSVAVMRKTGGVGSLFGHFIVLVLTVWWTFFIGNVLYAAYKYFAGSQELRIKIG